MAEGADRGSTRPTVREQAIHTALAFLLVEGVRRRPDQLRRSHKDMVLSLRDSLSYRSEALSWHLQLLRLLKTSAEQRLDDSFPDHQREFELLMLAGFEQHWVFDDLVFNALSAFDYLGNLVGFVYYGERRRKSKWDRVQKCARDRNYELQQNEATRISGGLAGPVISAAHTTLVSGLADYRAALIHYEALVGTGVLNTAHSENTRRGISHELVVHPPREFYKLLRRSSPETGEPLQAAALWLLDRCDTALYDILRALERDLRIEAGENPDTRDGAIEMIV